MNAGWLLDYESSSQQDQSKAKVLATKLWDVKFPYAVASSPYA